jgi:hypothetical protein
MAKIRVMSDLHIEFGELSVPTLDADLVVLAGDVHVGLAAAAWADDLAKRLGVPVVLIAGNHEHYGSLRRPGQHLGGIIEGLRAAAAVSSGRVVFLERETAIVAGIRFVGCTLWTDFELAGDPDTAMAQAENAMNDFRSIAYRPGVRFTARDARHEVHAGPAISRKRAGQAFRRPDRRHHAPSAVAQIGSEALRARRAQPGFRLAPRCARRTLRRRPLDPRPHP